MSRIWHETARISVICRITKRWNSRVYPPLLCLKLFPFDFSWGLICFLCIYTAAGHVYTADDVESVVMLMRSSSNIIDVPVPAARSSTSLSAQVKKSINYWNLPTSSQCRSQQDLVFQKKSGCQRSKVTMVSRSLSIKINYATLKSFLNLDPLQHLFDDFLSVPHRKKTVCSRPL